MRINTENIRKLETFYSGYLEGEKVDNFFEEFGIKFAAGHWAAGDFCDRFAPGGYNTNVTGFESTIPAQLERIAKAGIKGTAIHNVKFLNKDYKLDRNKIEEIKEALGKYNLILTTIGLDFFSDPIWKLGSITNPNEEIRKKFLEITFQALDIAKEMKCSTLLFWPGSDGWDYNFEANYQKLLDRFLEGCIAINKEAKKKNIRFGIESKLHEPREGNMVVPTAHLGVLIANTVNQECGGKNMGICIDYGHEQMYASEPAFQIYVAKKFDVPIIDIHLNTAKLHSNDEDRITGTGDIWRLVEFCYAAIDIGYDGWFCEDQFTYRTEPIKSMLLSKEFFANAMKKALNIYANKEKLEKAQASGDALETLEVVKKIIF